MIYILKENLVQEDCKNCVILKIVYVWCSLIQNQYFGASQFELELSKVQLHTINGQIPNVQFEF